MASADDFAFHLDAPSGWHWTEPAVTLAGWACSRHGRQCSDLRGVLGGTVFLGLYGLERPDVAVHRGGAPGSLRSGFRLTLAPWLGTHELSLQLLDADHGWIEFHRCTVTTDGALPASPPPPVVATRHLAETLTHLYRFHPGHRPAALFGEAARALAELATPATAFPPPPGLHGTLEFPGSWIDVPRGRFRLNGWVFSDDPSQPLKGVTATLGPTAECRLIWGQERPDVAAHFPSSPAARRSNFHGWVDLPPNTPGPICVQVFVEYADGRRVPWLARRLLLPRPAGREGPAPKFRRRSFWLCGLALARPALLGPLRFESWRGFRAALTAGRRELAAAGRPTPAPTVPADDPFALWRRHNSIAPRLAAWLRATGSAAAARPGAPTIAFIVPTYNTPPHYLAALIASVQAQFYPKWELCFADDASPQPHVREGLAAAAAADPRIKVVVRPTNGHIAAASNSALELATGAYVAFLDHDDLVTPDAALHVAEAILAHPGAGLLYTDEDKVDDHDRYFDPQFKGAWNPEMAIAHNFVHHLTVMRRDLVERVGRLRSGFVGAQDLDLILRVAELTPNDQVVHVPFLCYHWRAHAESTASRGDQKGYLFDSARRAIAEACQRRGLRAEPFLPPLAATYALCLHQLRWDPRLLEENPVTVVLPAADRFDQLERCLDALDRTVRPASVRLVVVDAGSSAESVRAGYAAIARRPGLPLRIVRADSTAAPSPARLLNLGTAAAETPLVLHLDPALEAERPGWLEDMVGWLSIDGVGTVGAKLVRPDRTLVHAGLRLGPQGGLPEPLFAGLHEGDFGTLFLPHAARNCAAVAGACLLTRTELFRRLGGYDETRFPLAFHDVDYCLRASDSGQRTVFTPQAVLLHTGQPAAAPPPPPAGHDSLAFLARHGGRRDPFLSEVLLSSPPHFNCDPADRRLAARDFPLRVRAIATRPLAADSARLACELARCFQSAGGGSVRITVSEDGPLRSAFAAEGRPVDSVDLRRLHAATTAADFDAAIAQLASTLPWQDDDLIVGHGLASFWAVPVARTLGKPCMLYLHEAVSLEQFFAGTLAPAVLPRAEEAVTQATRVVFTSPSARAAFAPLGGRAAFRTLPACADLPAPDRPLTGDPQQPLSVHLRAAREAFLESLN